VSGAGEAAGLARTGLATLLDAPSEIGQPAANVIRRTRDLRTGLVLLLLLCRTRHEVGTGDPARKAGDRDTARGGLADSLGLKQLGNEAKAAEHRKAHERYRPDDNARDRAIELARRRDPAGDHAAQSVAIYPLHRPGAPELPTAPVASNPEPGLQATR